MRKIKFRGKDQKNNEWVYGSLISEELEGRKGKCMVSFIAPYLPCASEKGDLWTAFMKRVKPETVGQFTGLCDKNGKEIYEGDIVEYYELCTYCINPDCEPHLIGYGDSLCKKTSEVEFAIDGSFELCYCGLHKEDLDELKEREERDAYFETNGYEINDSIIGIKVIGNIHDNPELINK